MNVVEQFRGIRTLNFFEKKYLHTKWSIRQFKRDFPEDLRTITPLLPKPLAVSTLKSGLITASTLVLGDNPTNLINVLSNEIIAGVMAIGNYKLMQKYAISRAQLKPKTRAFEAQDIVNGTETGLIIINSLILLEMLNLNLDFLQKSLGLAALGITNIVIYFDSLRRTQRLRKYDGEFLDRG